MKLCQILDNKAHWIFESDAIPIFAPDIIIKDITNLIPQPQEGWDYNSQTDAYTAPSNIPIVPRKTPIELLQDQLDLVQATATDNQNMINMLMGV
mgnify:CR=1 FL=1